MLKTCNVVGEHGPFGKHAASIFMAQENESKMTLK
jgi:hypothetical protein